jgi:hypothetical protein
MPRFECVGGLAGDLPLIVCGICIDVLCRAAYHAWGAVLREWDNCIRDVKAGLKVRMTENATTMDGECIRYPTRGQAPRSSFT